MDSIFPVIGAGLLTSYGKKSKKSKFSVRCQNIRLVRTQFGFDRFDASCGVSFGIHTICYIQFALYLRLKWYFIFTK